MGGRLNGRVHAQVSDALLLRMQAQMSPEAVVLIETLCRSTPEARPRAEDVMTLPWFSSAASSVNAPARPAATRSKGEADEEYLTEAQETLNHWYDEFLFEGMSARLEQMSATD